MGARTSRIKYNQWDLNQLAETSGLSRSEIDRLHSDYIQAAGRDGIMNMDEFIRFYSRLPGIEIHNTRTMKEQAAQIFQTFDRDRTNTLSFDEFLAAIVMMNQNTSYHDRIDYLIRQNNIEQSHQDNGFISSKYGHQILRRLIDYYGLPAGREHQYWKQIDLQNRGYVTQEEFIDYISQHSDFHRK